MATKATKAKMAASDARTALIISGGAPDATLVAGALVAFHEAGLEFDVVSTAGAGALLGLMYLAPRNGDPVSTLKGVMELGIADALYQRFPVNFKVFNKPGALADLYRSMLAANPMIQLLDKWQVANPVTQLMKDSAELALATVCPSDLNPASLGLCAHVPFAEEIIDFGAIAGLRPQFFVNAYNLTRHEMVNFKREEMNPQHLKAALSFPFLYPPTEIGGEFYIEGAAIDCLNFHKLLENCPNLEEIVVFDILGAEKLLRPPRDLYDAWVMSIITPLVEIARDDLKIFEAAHLGKYPKLKKPYPVPLLESVAEKDMPDVLDWSRSNLENLFQIGYEAAKTCAKGDLAHLAGS